MLSNLKLVNLLSLLIVPTISTAPSFPRLIKNCSIKISPLLNSTRDSKDFVKLYLEYILSEDKFNLPFPLLADINKNMCTDYDVLVDKIVHGHTVKGIARITFLIDESGINKKIWNPVEPNGHAEKILNVISGN